MRQGAPCSREFWQSVVYPCPRSSYLSNSARLDSAAQLRHLPLTVPVLSSWDFSGLEPVWWHADPAWRPGGPGEWRKPGVYVHAGEPEEPFRRRMEAFKAWLAVSPAREPLSVLLFFARTGLSNVVRGSPQDRPEQRIAVVSHWGVIYALTGARRKQRSSRLSDVTRDAFCA